MKLKKIVSLALAGILAVSMLTACGEGGSSSKPTEDPTPTTPTGYSKDVWDNLEKAAQSKVKYADSTELNSALKTAMGYAANNSIAFGYDWAMRTTPTLAKDAESESILSAAKHLIDLMDAENKQEQDIATAFEVINPYLQKDEADKIKDAKKDDKNISLLFVVDGGVQYPAVMDDIADLIEKDVLKLEDDYKYSENNGNSDVVLDYEYTLSVSAYTTTLSADHGKSLTFVAVNVARDFE